MPPIASTAIFIPSAETEKMFTVPSSSMSISQPDSSTTFLMASVMIGNGNPRNLRSNWKPVIPFSVPAILQSMSQNASSQPMMSVRSLYREILSLSSCSVQSPMLIPATGLVIGTPASIMAKQPPQTVAIEVDPFDSMI